MCWGPLALHMWSPLPGMPSSLFLYLLELRVLPGHLPCHVLCQAVFHVSPGALLGPSYSLFSLLSTLWSQLAFPGWQVPLPDVNAPPPQGIVSSRRSSLRETEAQRGSRQGTCLPARRWRNPGAAPSQDAPDWLLPGGRDLVTRYCRCPLQAQGRPTEVRHDLTCRMG